MKKIIVVLGVPFSGKTTQSKNIAKKLNFKYCFFEDILKKEIEEKTAIGIVVEKYLKSSIDIPDEYFIMLMKETIINLKEDGIVFDGYPKTINQAKSLDSFLFFRKTTKPYVVFLNMSLQKIRNRVDSVNKGVNVEEIFNQSMGKYNTKTKNTINYYHNNKIHIDLNDENIDSAFEKIYNTLLSSGF
jgi:adenylate kinase